MTMSYATFVERARARAQDQRHQARWNDGRLTVRSDSTPDERYEQSFEVLDTGALWMHCSCPSGLFRGHLLIPCKHCTRWGDRMVRELGVRTIKFVEDIYWIGEADTSRRSVILSTTTSADLCATRILDNLKTTAQVRDLTPDEVREYNRLSELLNRAQ